MVLGGDGKNDKESEVEEQKWRMRRRRSGRVLWGHKGENKCFLLHKLMT